jgi:1-acyl-sn-glycerol-3-phosphate acyltransferase
MAADIHPRTSFLIRGARLARLVWHLLQGLASVAFTFPFRSTDSRRRRIRRWSAQLLPLLGCHLRASGAVPGFDTRGALFVSNHVSWVEIFAVKAVCPARFVAKSEIRRWPVIGWLCAGVGTIFIERERRRGRRAWRTLATSNDLQACIREAAATTITEWPRGGAANVEKIGCNTCTAWCVCATWTRRSAFIAKA